MPPAYTEDLFCHLLVTERKRSERSNRPFVLLTVTTKTPALAPPTGGLDVQPSAVAKAALEAAKAASRDTDIVGWAKWPTTVGVIFSELGATDPAKALAVLRDRMNRELIRRMDARMLREVSVELRIYPHSSSSDAPNDQDGQEGQVDQVDPLLHLDLHRADRARKVADGVKRAVDMLGSAFLLLMLTPVLLCVAAAVRLTSPGPVLFKQVRLGRWGTPFKMLKFRTMIVNAAATPHLEFVTRFIKESGTAPASATGGVFKLTNDPRITPVGRFLRKTSLDELPQLWNVLIGEMSLVGPRPPLPYELEHYAPWHRRRVLEAKPGVTGLWQVTGRSRTTFDEMVRLDLRYAKTRSLWTDVRILLRTPRAVVGGKGAV
jgi:lipopolysaccharide/colanic/teichoic acid biosynthesis glycosyltransferase